MASDSVRYVLTAHLRCEDCGHGWDHGLEVVETDDTGAITPAEAITCPKCGGLLWLDLGPIRLRSAWPTSRGAGRRTQRRAGRAVVRGRPISE